MSCQLHRVTSGSKRTDRREGEKEGRKRKKEIAVSL